MSTIRRTLAQIIYERTPRLCLGCCTHQIIVDPVNEFCSDCRLATKLRKRFSVPTLSREYVLANTNDGSEYVPEDEEWVSA